MGKHGGKTQFFLMFLNFRRMHIYHSKVILKLNSHWTSHKFEFQLQQASRFSQSCRSHRQLQQELSDPRIFLHDLSGSI